MHPLGVCCPEGQCPQWIRGDCCAECFHNPWLLLILSSGAANCPVIGVRWHYLPIVKKTYTFTIGMICQFKREKREYKLSAQLNIFVIFNCLKNYYCSMKVRSLEFAYYQMTKFGPFLRRKAYLLGNNLGDRRLLFMMIFNVIFSATVCVKLQPF